MRAGRSCDARSPRTVRGRQYLPSLPSVGETGGRRASRGRREGEPLACGSERLRGMAPGDTARLYHRLSSYGGVPGVDWPTADRPSPGASGLRPQRPSDVSRPTASVYPDGLPSIELPAAWAPVPRPDDRPPGRTLRVRSRRCSTWAGLPASSTSRPGSCASPCVGTAGGSCFALRGRLAVCSRSSCTWRRVASPGCRDGVHWYDPVGHALRHRRTSGDGGRHDASSMTGNPVADGMAIRGARVPAPLLGRRLDAREHARARASRAAIGPGS